MGNLNPGHFLSVNLVDRTKHQGPLGVDPHVLQGQGFHDLHSQPGQTPRSPDAGPALLPSCQRLSRDTAPHMGTGCLESVAGNGISSESHH